MTHDHDDDHDHEHGSELSEMQLRVRALETVLAEKGYVDPAALDAMIEAFETKIGPHIGARVVAKAWSDPEFKRALIGTRPRPPNPLGASNRVGDHLIAVENTPNSTNGRLHPLLLLSVGSARPAAGLVQIRSLSLARGERSARRARRFRRHAAGGYQIRVWDSTAETRFIVCRCARPAPKAGAKRNSPTLVTRDSMIGTGLPKHPHEVV